MVRPYPRLAKTQLSDLRMKVDAGFLDVVRRLEDAYYGTCLTWNDEGQPLTRRKDGWRAQSPHPVTLDGVTYNMQATLELSKQLFDRLHGIIWETHRLCLYLQNEADGKLHGELELAESWEPDAVDPANIRRRVTRDLKLEAVENMKRKGVMRQAIPLHLRTAFNQLVP